MKLITVGVSVIASDNHKQVCAKIVSINSKPPKMFMIMRAEDQDSLIEKIKSCLNVYFKEIKEIELKSKTEQLFNLGLLINKEQKYVADTLSI